MGSIFFNPSGVAIAPDLKRLHFITVEAQKVGNPIASIPKSKV